MSMLDHFQQITLSPCQETAIGELEAFFTSKSQVFMLKGYAGSGKTTVLKGLVEYLSEIDKSVVLMAPTGRAAKVIKERTHQEASTIHRAIYSFSEMVEVEEGNSFFYQYKIRNNIDVAGTIFIVDEASMISDTKNEGEFFRFGTGCLLSDLVAYSRVTSPEAETRIIFVGDPCQLPPVGDNSSKAFDPSYLEVKFGIISAETEMKEVKRQGGESGILKSATKIRKGISSGYFNDFSLQSNNSDIFNPSHASFLDIWEKASTPKIIIASKNKTCLDLNMQIRERRFGDMGLPIQKGDILIMGGNNTKKGVFNGEFAVVNDVGVSNISRPVFLKGKVQITLRWRDVEMVFPDSEGGEKVVSGMVLENFLYGDNSLRPEEFQALYVDFINRHEHLKPRTMEFRDAIMNDEFFNCLLVKYGYAVTCHKAQGGEWENVFTIWDQENQKDFNFFSGKQVKRSKDNVNFYRWAYTAITRASKTLYALNPPSFNSYSSMAFVYDVNAAKAISELTGKKLPLVEIVLDNDWMQQLSRVNILEQPIQIQDQFIRVLSATQNQNIDVVGWERKNMEVFCLFKRKEETAALKTWINKDFAFNGKYQKVPSQTNSEELFVEVDQILKNMPEVLVVRNTPETIFSKIEFEVEFEEQFPFLQCLNDDLYLLLDKVGVSVEDVQHQKYHERYTFGRNQEKAVINFWYNDKGFFGTVDPLMNKTNSHQLLTDIHQVLQTLKTAEYAD
ncbi:MAG: AAA family ATPase [Bacteroidetes bacterium]|nr:AAA family ATPase [Bacteroidota bacterium]